MLWYKRENICVTFSCFSLLEREKCEIHCHVHCQLILVVIVMDGDLSRYPQGPLISAGKFAGLEVVDK